MVFGITGFPGLGLVGFWDQNKGGSQDLGSCSFAVNSNP